MVVLLTGATGFIGRPLARALAAAGHEVVCAVRDAAAACRTLPGRCIAVDFTTDVAVSDWLPRLRGVDAVINAAGILRERGTQTFEAIHWRAPHALFAACAQAGITRVLQLSALGADDHARSRYHTSKKAADDFLLAQIPTAVVAQPSLVFAPGGASARLFTRLSTLPLLPLPRQGEMAVQPAHLDDVVRALVALLEDDAWRGQRVPLAGPTPLPLRDFLAGLRAQLGLPEARVLGVPVGLARLGAALSAPWPGALLDGETLDMLLRGNVGDPAPLRALCGGEARAPATFIAPRDAPALRAQGRLGWLLPMLRLSVALVWLVTGLVSLGLFPTSQSYALLARVGVPGDLAPLLLYGAAAVNLLLGLATLLWPRRVLWAAQATLVLFYTAIITVRLPEFWLHPFGPILKNLPLLVVLWMLYEFEER